MEKNFDFQNGNTYDNYIAFILLFKNLFASGGVS